MLHPNTRIQYIDDSIGYGVFATSFIPKGTITWVRDLLDKEISPDEMHGFPFLVYETALTYSYRNNKGNYLLPWDHTRYVNHSFRPNTMITPYGFEIAIADIAKGEQITNDYGTLNIIEPFEPINEGSDRKIVYPNDLETFYSVWDQWIKEGIVLIRKVDQPLGSLLSEDLWNEMDEIHNGHSKPKSIRDLVFKG
jgi:uncharacterized protein